MILRYTDELRKPETNFEKIDAKPKPDAVQLAVELIEEHSGKFEQLSVPPSTAIAAVACFTSRGLTSDHREGGLNLYSFFDRTAVPVLFS